MPLHRLQRVGTLYPPGGVNLCFNLTLSAKRFSV
jgi:hypothetical protein